MTQNYRLEPCGSLPREERRNGAGDGEGQIKMLTNRGRGATKAGKLKDVVDRHRKPLTETEAELAQARRWLVEVRTERALLKRFATYFAKASR